MRGICDGVSQGLGLQSICRDLGFNYKLRIHSDATAAIGIARRRGMGKISHLDCSDLWVQEKIRSQKIKLTKINGSENPADASTKHGDKNNLNMSMSKIGMHKLNGRPAYAPDTMGLN